MALGDYMGTGLDPEMQKYLKEQQLIGALQGILSSSGPSQIKVSPGQVIGAGLAGGMQGSQHGLGNIMAMQKMKANQDELDAKKRTEEFWRNTFNNPKTVSVDQSVGQGRGMFLPEYQTGTIEVPRTTDESARLAFDAAIKDPEIFARIGSPLASIIKANSPDATTPTTELKDYAERYYGGNFTNALKAINSNPNEAARYEQFRADKKPGRADVFAGMATSQDGTVMTDSQGRTLGLYNVFDDKGNATPVLRPMPGIPGIKNLSQMDATTKQSVTFTNQLLDLVNKAEQKYNVKDKSGKPIGRNWVGPIDNLRGKLGTYVNAVTTPEEQEFRTLLESIMNIKGKEQAGSAWSEAEMNRVEAEAARAFKGETSFGAAINNLKDILNNKLKNIGVTAKSTGTFYQPSKATPGIAVTGPGSSGDMDSFWKK